MAKINFAIKSKRLGTGDDPDWVYINDTWYQDNEVALAKAEDLEIHETSERLGDCPNLDKFHVDSAVRQGSWRQNRWPAAGNFDVGDIVKVTDQATGNTAISKIDVTWPTTGFVMVKGVQYANRKVAHATTPERGSYQSSEASPGSPTHSDTPQTNLGYSDYGSSESESSC